MLAQITNFTNATTIGIYKNTSTERIYLFVTADEGDYIIEYNALTRACAQIVVDTNGILNWNAGMHVTGIQMIESRIRVGSLQTESLALLM